MTGGTVYVGAESPPEAEPTGPVCSRCGKRAVLSAPAEPDVGLFGDLYACPTDGEFYEDREGFTIRQVFLDDSAPTYAVPVEVATELDGEEVLF